MKMLDTPDSGDRTDKRDHMWGNVSDETTKSKRKKATPTAFVVNASPHLCSVLRLWPEGCLFFILSCVVPLSVLIRVLITARHSIRQG
jgi:hypothetical protein